jgi:hypothetical protein
MSGFFDRVHVPKWRIVSYAIVAAIGVATLGYLLHDHSYYFAAVPCGLFVGIWGFFADKIRTNPKLAEAVAELRKQNERKKAEKKDP